MFEVRLKDDISPYDYNAMGLGISIKNFISKSPFKVKSVQTVRNRDILILDVPPINYTVMWVYADLCELVVKKEEANDITEVPKL